MKVYLVFDHVRYEGSQVRAVYSDEVVAEAHAADLRAGENSFDMSFYVSELDLEDSYTPVNVTAPTPHV